MLRNRPKRARQTIPVLPFGAAGEVKKTDIESDYHLLKVLS